MTIDKQELLDPHAPLRRKTIVGEEEQFVRDQKRNAKNKKRAKVKRKIASKSRRKNK
jgi:hypothetical protein